MAQKIVIAGGGFGGLEAALSLKRLLGRRAGITLVDREQYHFFIPSIHLIVSGSARPSEISIPLKPVLGVAGIDFVQDEISSVNPAAREVSTANGGALKYDYLLISCGAENNFFSIPGAEQFSHRFRTSQNAESIRAALDLLLASGDRVAITVAGAGTEGVEVAGELLEAVRKRGLEQDLESGAIAIELIEGKSRLLPDFPDAVRNFAESYLRTRGVAFIGGSRITEVRHRSIILESGEERPAALLIWSGGIQPSKLVRDLPLSKDPWGWLKVSDRLRTVDDPRIYAIGDAVSVYTEDGPLSLPRLAYHAQDQARVGAFNIARSIDGKEQIAYVPRNRPQLISLGRSMGILAREGQMYSGAWVVALKKVIERKHLMTYLAKPFSPALRTRLPGAGIVQRLRIRMPV